METPPAKKMLYLHLYKGVKPLFRLAIHTSLYVEGDGFEWTYGPRSLEATTHNRELNGVFYERPLQHTYGDWEFWKAVPLGHVESGFGLAEEEEDARASRASLKLLAGDKFYDGGYDFTRNNCWDFCYTVAEELGHGLKDGDIERYNDNLQGVWPGSTARVRGVVNACRSCC